ncbi:MAG: LemA family protein [Acidimicrobiia bacterium]|nr:LemA family protein [Acidimicrobiia bacterium]
MIGLIVAAGVLVVLVVWALASYNRFVRQDHYIDNSWSNVETELQRRYELIPNLVATVRAYADHEQETLTNVIEARAGAAAVAQEHDPATQEPFEQQLVRGVRQLMAVSERYPELRADERFLDLQRQLVVTEDRIQAARRLFNGNVRDYNSRVESVPSAIVARATGYGRRDYFELDEAIPRSAPEIRV